MGPPLDLVVEAALQEAAVCHATTILSRHAPPDMVVVAAARGGGRAPPRIRPLPHGLLDLVVEAATGG